ncbi:MAG: Hpt domain-containing protein [Lachnospiraceae bacterium]|nr:Hpt domain-containing protein [Lachnospiraceae bacterium]MBQ7261517.1 Hpt domain-containing protein [Lachnospiraceae bacterium]
MIKDLKYEDLKEQGFDVDEGFTYTGSSEKYLAALQRFYRRSGKTTGYIREMSGEGQYEELTIVVHALKSNARTIGADHLAGLAEQMELLGKASSYAEMSAFKDELLSEMERVVNAIEPYGQMEEVHPKSEISAQRAEKAGAELIEAIEDFDDETALPLVDELMRYPFRFTLINVLKNAKEDIRDFEYTEALLKVRRVVSQIED